MSVTAQTSRRMLVVGVDAADWSLLHPLLDAGQLPALNGLVEGGASGRLLSAAPLIGPVQWASLATGKRPWQHGILNSSELADDNRSRNPLTAKSLHSTPVWEMLAQEGKQCVVIGWPATHGSEVKGVTVVSDAYPVPTAGPGVLPWPPPPAGTYCPADIGSRLDSLRVSPEQIQADVISLYLPQWQKIDQRRDHRLGQLRSLLATDFSYVGALTELLRRQSWDFAAVRLPASADIARLFLPYRPPRRHSVREQDFSIYSQVIQSQCRMLDLLLQQITQAAGQNTAIVLVSGHGLHGFDLSSQGSPAPDSEQWKSPYGIFAACGPGFASDALLHGATVMDLAPTILTWFGLPIGDDMEGRVLIESFATVPEVRHVASWDAPAPTTRKSPVLAGPESKWNFVRSALEAGQLEQVMPVLEDLFREFPERTGVAETLFECQLELKQTDAAGQTLEVLLEGLPPGPVAIVFQAHLAWAQGNLNKTRSLVQQAMQLQPSDRPSLGRLGILLFRLGEWDALADLARQGIALDELDPIAWLGLATAHLRKGQAQEAADAALQAIRLKYFLPDAHYILVRALVAQGEWARAREAMVALRKIQPSRHAVTQ